MKNKVYVGTVFCCALLFLVIGWPLLGRNSENSIAGTACVGWTCEEHREFDNILVSGVTMETAWKQCTDLLMLLRDDGCNNSDKYIKIKSMFLAQSGLLNEGDTVYLSFEEYSKYFEEDSSIHVKETNVNLLDAESLISTFGVQAEESLGVVYSAKYHAKLIRGTAGEVIGIYFERKDLSQSKQ